MKKLKPSDHMLRGLAMSGHSRKAIGTLLNDYGHVCAYGAYFLSVKGNAEDMTPDWIEIDRKFADEYHMGIAGANNGSYDDADAHPDENDQRGLSIPVIAGMLKAIGL